MPKSDRSPKSDLRYLNVCLCHDMCERLMFKVQFMWKPEKGGVVRIIQSDGET